MPNMDKTRWLSLCERAIDEEDAGKFRGICWELEQFLEQKKQRLRVGPSCWICGRIVNLEHCDVDAHGRAVHEECQASRMRES